tara:strand:+ start:226 stop:399 length:174 start_codon:yes stop_codon:yes gene_type:complete
MLEEKYAADAAAADALVERAEADYTLDGDYEALNAAFKAAEAMCLEGNLAHLAGGWL